MKKPGFTLLILGIALTACSLRTVAATPAEKTSVTVDWNQVIRVSNTNATLQVVVTPLMGRSSPIHDKVFLGLQDLHCDYVRFVPWLPYPKLVVAELEPPANGRTSWDFSLLDPFAIDFAQATEGHSAIWNFSTIPQWMFKTDKPGPFPADPNQPVWDYEKGTDLRDPSMKEVADYYGRLVSWYTQGGFTDELGKRHESGHHYKIDYWEVLNEPELEHRMSPQFYTALYDVVVGAIRKVDPKIKFVGAALANPSVEPQFFEYFLNHQNHQAGVPIDMISYHFYAVPMPEESFDVWPHTFFEQADGFLDVVRYIQSIRQRLSPETGTTIDEIGAISTDDFNQGKPGYVPRPIPQPYWNLCAALYGYLYGELARLGVEGVGESALAQLPGFYPSVSMMDWNTGEPNARYWALKLLRDNFGPGDKLVDASTSVPYVYALGFVGPDGKHKILLVNKRNRPFAVSIPGSTGGTVDYVDQTTGNHTPASMHLTGDTVNLGGLAVAVVTLAP
ncbi:MAG: glycosyl hydrolase family 39 [Acidobacteriota bacterium]|nr:glycosyl hydrolase family 39 [Acidobacteriota bacterium]